MGRARLGTLAAPGLTFVLVAAIAELGIRLAELPAYLAPPPSEVVRALWSERAQLLTATWSTATNTAAGFLLSACLGVGLGAAVGSSRWLRRGFYPLTNILQMVPLVAIAPLLTLWFGYGSSAVIASACIVSIFPVIANTVDGIQSVDLHLRELFQLYGASRWDTWRKLELPAALPQIFTGLRIAAGLAVIGAIVGEFVSGYVGDDAPIGIVILSSLREARMNLVFAAIGLSAMVGFALFGSVSWLGNRLLRHWHASVRTE